MSPLPNYKPFATEYLYYDKDLNERTYQMPSIFPEQGLDNMVICVSGVSADSMFSCLITNKIPCLDYLEKTQCFPLKIYEKRDNKDNNQGELIDNANDYNIKHGISDDGLAHFQSSYPNQEITKDDIFYYIYGLLHSHDYRDKFKDNLTKELPRIPCVKSYADYMKFVKAGRDLADLHLNYEALDKYNVDFNCNIDDLADDDFMVTKMKHAKKDDLTTIIYNEKITISNIPLDAYDYIVNGKTAIKWVMERQSIKTDKDSGIVNDANDYARETMNNPRYPLELLQRIITLSLRTQSIVNNLPKLDI